MCLCDRMLLPGNEERGKIGGADGVVGDGKEAFNDEVV